MEVDEEADNGMDKEVDTDMGHKKLSGHKKLFGHKKLSGHKSYLATKKLSSHTNLSGYKKLFGHKKLSSHKRLIIVKEVITEKEMIPCDVSPVAMFYFLIPFHWFGLL